MSRSICSSNFPPFGLIRAGGAPTYQRHTVHGRSVHIDVHPMNASDAISASRSVNTSATKNCLITTSTVICAVGTAHSRDLPRDQPENNWRAAIPHLISSTGTTDIPTTPTASSVSSGRRAIIIGNGNVALDIARVLLMSPRDLAGTDIAAHALDNGLNGSSIEGR